jgi:two-component system alkaline phosphatase synthesis response regulator PhoP
VQRKLILVVDDEQDLLDIISYNLKKDGFDVIVAENGRAALELAKVHKPDLILLDIMMPELDGFQVCKILKEDDHLKKIPVMFLTARGEEEMEVKGLDTGADDFLPKPISNKKLLSRVRAVFRRYGEGESDEATLSVHDLLIDKERYLVLKGEKQITLPKKEFELLYFLALRKGKVLNRQTLLNEVWGNNVFVVDRTIDVHIRKIREKVGDKYIETIKGVGYRFKT